MSEHDTPRTIAMPLPLAEIPADSKEQAAQERDDLRESFLESPGDGQLINNHLKHAAELLLIIDQNASMSAEELWAQHSDRLSKYAKRFNENGVQHSTRYLRSKVATAAARLDRLASQLAEREDLRKGAPVKAAIGTEGGTKEGVIHDGVIMTINANGRVLVMVHNGENAKPSLRPMEFEELEKYNPDPKYEEYYKTYEPEGK